MNPDGESITYRGFRDKRRGGHTLVFRIDQHRTRTDLDPAASLKIRNHSPDGFQWGYGGSGPAQLALAILLDLTDKNRAQRVYHDFKDKYVSHWGDKWEITDTEIKAWMAKQVSLQCTEKCNALQALFADGKVPESEYMGGLCDVHFDEYLDRCKKEEEGVSE